MEHAATELTKIMGELVRHAPADEAPLLAWPVVCGALVAGRTRALSFRAGVLRVEVPDATWRTQLSELEPQYRSGCAHLLGREAVTRIDFVLARES